MAWFLVPLLYDWVHTYSERRYLEPIKSYWNSRTAGRYPDFESLSLKVEGNNYDNRDAVDRIDESLCGGIQTQNTIILTRLLTKKLCEDTEDAGSGSPWFKTRDLDEPLNLTVTSDVGSGQLTKRTFAINLDARGSGQTTHPANTGDAIELLGNNLLRMEYYRWFRYNTNEVELEGKLHACQSVSITITSS